MVNRPLASTSGVTISPSCTSACSTSFSMSRSRSAPYSSTASRAPSSGSATASCQPRISAARKAFTLSGSSAIIWSVVITLSATKGRPLSAKGRLVTSIPWLCTVIDSLVR